MALKRYDGTSWVNQNNKLKVYDGSQWRALSEDDGSTGLAIRTRGVQAASVRGSIRRWQPVSNEFPFAEFYTTIRSGNQRLSGSAMAGARVHNKTLQLQSDIVHDSPAADPGSAFRFTGKCMLVYRLMWDVLAGGTSGSSGQAESHDGPSGQVEGPSGQQAGPSVTGNRIEYSNQASRWLASFRFSNLAPGDVIRTHYQEFTGSTPSGSSLRTGWRSVRTHTVGPVNSSSATVRGAAQVAATLSGFIFLPNPSSGRSGIIARCTVSRATGLIPIVSTAYLTRRYPTYTPPPEQPTAPPPPVVRPTNLRVQFQKSGNNIIVTPSATDGVRFRTRGRFGSGQYSIPSPPNTDGRYFAYRTGTHTYGIPTGATTFRVELFAISSDGATTGPAYFDYNIPADPAPPTEPPKEPDVAPPPPPPPAPVTEQPTEEEVDNPTDVPEDRRGQGEVVQETLVGSQPGINIEIARQTFQVGAVNPDNWETYWMDIGTTTPPTTIKFIGTGRSSGNYNDLTMWPSPNYSANSWDWRSVYLVLFYERV